MLITQQTVWSSELREGQAFDVNLDTREKEEKAKAKAQGGEVSCLCSNGEGSRTHACMILIPNCHVPTQSVN